MISNKSIIFNMILEKIITYFVGYIKKCNNNTSWGLLKKSSGSGKWDKLDFLALCREIEFYVRKKPQT